MPGDRPHSRIDSTRHCSPTHRASVDGAGSADIWTMVLWLTVAIAAVLGLCSRPRAAAIAPSMQQAERPVEIPPSEVSLSAVARKEESPAAVHVPPVASPPIPSSPPPIFGPSPISALPTWTALVPILPPSTPVPRGALQQPTLIQSLDGAPASDGTATQRPAAEVRIDAPPRTTALTFGVGAGNQPAPEYPPAARSRRQQGAVGLRIRVRPDGTVTEAAVSVPSSWPLLDEAALRVVRERWHFEPGEERLHDVTIRFELNKQP